MTRIPQPQLHLLRHRLIQMRGQLAEIGPKRLAAVPRTTQFEKQGGFREEALQSEIGANF